MAEVKNIIIKATLKADRCDVSYKERYVDANYTNKVNKECDQIVHDDLKQAFRLLRPFLVTIAEQPESKLINSGNIDVIPDEKLEEELSKYVVTGYVRGGSDDSAGVTIIGQKILKSGQVLNLISPFTKFIDPDSDGYPYGEELGQAIERCDWEVTEYLFEGKYGIIQQQLDFDADTPQEANITQEKPKKAKKGRKKKEKEETVPFDQYA